MENRIFIGLLIAASIHIFEEYILPGGFAKAFIKLIPRSSHLFTVKFHVIVNGVFILFYIISSKQLSWVQAGLSFILGLLYMGVLMIYVLVQQRDSTNDEQILSKEK